MTNGLPRTEDARRSARRAGVPARSFNHPGVRALFYQGLLVAALALAAWYVISNTGRNLAERNIASGFAFLWREAGFEISETTLLSYDAADTYFRAIAVGFFNTLRVAAIATVLATVLGTLIGLARLARNWLLARLASGYVEAVRNVPLLVQLFFWYSIITEYLPAPVDAINPLSDIFISNRGVYFPAPQWHPIYAWCGVALIAGVILARALSGYMSRKQALVLGSALAAGLPTALILATGIPIEISHPKLGGFNFLGGAALSPEFAALLVGLVIYTAAFIAEIVRAGILAVDRGQFEAAHSLGLSRWRATRLVILPQALRAIVPPLTSQYLNVAKNSSLAVAIGYPDLVSIANTTINQTGQAIEGIAVIIVAYLSISLTLSALMNWYNRHVALKGGTP